MFIQLKCGFKTFETLPYKALACSYNNFVVKEIFDISSRDIQSIMDYECRVYQKLIIFWKFTIFGWTSNKINVCVSNSNNKWISFSCKM